MTLKELIAVARKALEEGDLEKAEELRKKAEALKALDALDQPEPAPSPQPEPEPKPEPVAAAVKASPAPATAAPQPQRIPFPTTAPAAPPTIDSLAIKSWFVKRYGEPQNAVEHIAKELYGQEYMALAWAKSADFKRYLRSGHYDPQLSRVMLLTPDQITEAVVTGVPVAEMKATMIEGQDTLGGLAKAA